MTFSSAKNDQQQNKLKAAHRALEFVESGMTIGLGSGTTATLWIDLLGERVREGRLSVRGVATSEASETLARSYGIPLITLEECDSLDLAVDGADEIAPGLSLIKGGGGKLLREKIVASSAKRFVVIADDSKIVERLGKFPLPVEVVPMALPLVCRSLRSLGFTPSLRKNPEGSRYITDEGNLLLDCSGLYIDDPPAMARELDSLVGVVEHGLFLGMAEQAIVANAEDIRIVRP
ncbi:ribose-5-phosphate isomerase RpiA [Paracidobacterium acidisoli]|uniref:Ribose-5-phosphate isomerase A n=1 Tax=Paracidobacterium acidisoli TaxID=2303751 RepID=A0A372INA2_9BACT|nr:ribose-5-phosphate isomerase RpiA [Paracidobacterium acidisoli]MBT9332054.1 ribose-5-phosphate isomerase RpiA [Paracidobacterium acidisoli]